MISVLILIALSLILTVGVATCIGSTMHEIRAINRKRAIAKHPYSKKWRKRPLISIVFANEPTKECLASIKDNRYRKIEYITDNSQQPNGELVFRLNGNEIIESRCILDAVLESSDRADNGHITLRQKITTPNTLIALLRTYRQFTSELFDKSNSALSSRIGKKWQHAGTIIGACANISLSALVAYIIYIAAVLRQPEALGLALSVFVIFMTMTIWSIERLGFWSKLVYWFLMPVSFGYFLIVSWLVTIKIFFSKYSSSV